MSKITLDVIGPKLSRKYQPEKIHQASLKILKNTGLRVENKKATEIFHSSGAYVEGHKDYNIVKLPPHVVEDCINWTPEKVVCYGRESHNDLLIETQSTFFGGGGGSVRIIDPYSGKLRPTIKKDTGIYTLICDAIDEISMVVRPCIPNDVPCETYPLHALQEILKNTSKHTFISANTGVNLKKMIEMGAACTGDMNIFERRPIFSVMVCPTSPLKLTKSCCDQLIEGVQSELPLFVITMAIAGATAPFSIMGTLAMTNAEILGAITLAQLTKKGTACIYGNYSTVMDLKIGEMTVSAPEGALITIGSINLAQYYKIPCLAGLMTDSNIINAQAGYESCMNMITASMAGANIVLGAGMLDKYMTIDLAKLLLDAELIGIIKRIIKGIDTGESDFDIDITHEVGPGGEFLTHKHTFDNMRTMHQGGLFDRKSREIGAAEDGENIAEQAYERARHILKTHTPKALPNGAEEAMRSIIAEYEKELSINTK